MPTMTFYVLILLGLLVVFFALGVMLLRWGLRLAKAHKPTVRRVVPALALIALAQTAVLIDRESIGDDGRAPGSARQ